MEPTSAPGAGPSQPRSLSRTDIVSRNKSSSSMDPPLHRASSPSSSSMASARSGTNRPRGRQQGASSIGDADVSVAVAAAPALPDGTTRGLGSTAMRWRSESRTLRGSVDDRRSRSRSLHPWRKQLASRSTSRAPGKGKLQPTGHDVEKGQQGQQDPSPPQPWYKRCVKMPLGPLVRHIPPWLEAYIWGLIGGFVGVGCVIIIFTRATSFSDSNDVVHGPWTAPAIVGSFGASAVLLYSVPASPLSQPRTFFFGQVLSSIIGVGITKLFALNTHFDINNTDHKESLVWVAGALATGVAILVMQVTRTTHPPGGATAVLAATSPPVVSLGWHYIPVVMLSSAVMIVWAVVWMNAGRKLYPEWWFFPPEKVRKTAFPGPQLMPYVRKLKPSRKSTANADKSEGILPTHDARHDSEWRDESNWKAAEEGQQQQQQQLQVNRAEENALPHVDEREEQQLEERRSRWDRPDGTTR